MLGKEWSDSMKSLRDAYINEVWKGKHGQTDKQYADSRSDGGKMVSGDSKMSGAEYTHGRRVKAANPGMQPDVGGKTKPKSQGKMDKGTRADMQYRKANLMNKENVEIYSSLGDAYSTMYEKKKDCKDGYHWDSDEKKCVKNKSRGMAHGYGLHIHHHDDDGEDGGDGGDGGVGGGDGGGGGE